MHTKATALAIVTFIAVSNAAPISDRLSSTYVEHMALENRSSLELTKKCGGATGLAEHDCLSQPNPRALDPRSSPACAFPAQDGSCPAQADIRRRSPEDDSSDVPAAEDEGSDDKPPKNSPKSPGLPDEQPGAEPPPSQEPSGQSPVDAPSQPSGDSSSPTSTKPDNEASSTPTPSSGASPTPTPSNGSGSHTAQWAQEHEIDHLGWLGKTLFNWFGGLF